MAEDGAAVVSDGAEAMRREEQKRHSRRRSSSGGRHSVASGRLQARTGPSPAGGAGQRAWSVRPEGPRAHGGMGKRRR
jgi:hypothetical protein